MTAPIHSDDLRALPELSAPGCPRETSGTTCQADCPEHCRKLAGAWERGPRWTLIRRSDHGTVAVVEELWDSDGRTNRWVWSCGTFTDGKQYRRADACQSKADAHLRSLGYELEEDGGNHG